MNHRAILLVFFISIFPLTELDALSHQNGLNIETESSSEPISHLYGFGEMVADTSDFSPRLQELANEFESIDLDLISLLEDPRFELYETIGDRFRNSAERKMGSLEDYMDLLNTDQKKREIPDFIKSHEDAFAEAEKEYEIPRYVIASIIAIESNFGRNIGRYNPLNVYVSMYAVDYRTRFAKAQLEELLKFVEKKNLDVYELKSSYAGAMSYGQFIPYSMNRWFVGEDIFDMRNNILSIANYLAHFKEITGSMSGAVYRYNPSSLYRDAVLALAEQAEQENAM